ncbi:endonuclease/exonuclease/phosphatase family protein [Agrobacterium rubi]|uniref:Endonuclease/exonuclease/phosphatase family protein n=1 Tax=Agrobacterium rubi TaxID=28099 RepID=A0AAE7RBZ0_9HYPH|nr:endonuclease/exonuclease/phosphatase family protein [Agrobacterium rubi]NTE87421.1 endonuclease/exonuclease/phosphatase family protein [Agrobacterium rubi]NTF03275.1 endonuclease/exonuclease/phosphatase family protein [Agrobacterium rubi]NTF37435.1 endonuclease/exonuclease/phosphatase family protein [Agrobacterium rubi]OCJ53484.1 endonuclease [Agrobacterium rubi]QTG02511.1 endonuclease/exonuclease/phosphatase family protein [Agrobacterium rubi]
MSLVSDKKSRRTKQESLPSFIVTSFRNRKNGGSKTDPCGEAKLPIIASYNVHKCVGRDRKFDPDRISHVIQEIGADIIALQEADSRFGERTGLLDLLRLERECGLSPVPITAGAKAHGWHGNVVLFKEGAVRDVHPLRLPGLEPRGALVVELDLKQGGTLRVIAAHFGLLRHSRAQQARALVDLLNTRDEQPTVLLGDLNEWRLGNGSSLNTFRDAFGSLPPAVPSFPSGLPVLALDRIISNREGLIDNVTAHESALSSIASDHLPLKATIRTDILTA